VRGTEVGSLHKIKHTWSCSAWVVEQEEPANFFAGQGHAYSSNAMKDAQTCQQQLLHSQERTQQALVASLSCLHCVLAARISTRRPTDMFVRLTCRPATYLSAIAAIAGKSSLLNAMCGEERVIVCDLSGTTRDAVDTEVTLEDGTRLTLIDTAGIRKRTKVLPSGQLMHDSRHVRISWLHHSIIAGSVSAWPARFTRVRLVARGARDAGLTSSRDAGGRQQGWCGAAERGPSHPCNAQGGYSGGRGRRWRWHNPTSGEQTACPLHESFTLNADALLCFTFEVVVAMTLPLWAL
jgi:hypothetical protein